MVYILRIHAGILDVNCKHCNNASTVTVAFSVLTRHDVIQGLQAYKEAEVALNSSCTMNDPGLDEPIQDIANNITHNLKQEVVDGDESNSDEHGPKAAFRHELQVDEDEEEVGFYQPT